MKEIIILGSTGSIGTQTLRVIDRHSDKLKAIGLACGASADLFIEQLHAYKPRYAAVSDDKAYEKVKNNLPNNTVLFGGGNALSELCSAGGEIVVSAISGTAGLFPTLSAIMAGKDIALANKETLVSCGELVMRTAQEKGVKILPVDSEHSAVWQAVRCGAPREIKKIILTASGGPFFGYRAEQLDGVSLQMALSHPTWKMGKKVTIDSATLMNKGLEVIEAMHLFGVPADKIDVVIHRESRVHSMVQFCDNSIIAELSVPSMELPIQYALSYPERWDSDTEEQSFDALNLNFSRPDSDTFSCLKIAYDCARKGGTAPAIMNIANEIAVNDFIKGIIKFRDIPYYINKALNAVPSKSSCGAEDIVYLTEKVADVLTKGERK